MFYIEKLLSKHTAKTQSRDMEEDLKYMEAALREAESAADEDEVPIGAVIVCGGKIIAKGHNMTERLNDPTAHAEMIALTSATEFIGGKYLNDCTLYVTVEPCPMCAAALGWAQLGQLVYGTSDPKKGYTRYTPSLLHPRTKVRADVMKDKCSELMVNYFTKKR